MAPLGTLGGHPKSVHLNPSERLGAFTGAQSDGRSSSRWCGGYYDHNRRSLRFEPLHVLAQDMRCSSRRTEDRAHSFGGYDLRLKLRPHESQPANTPMKCYAGSLY